MSTAANNMPQAFGFGFNDEDIEDDGDREMPATINDGEPPDDTCETRLYCSLKRGSRRSHNTLEAVRSSLRGLLPPMPRFAAMMYRPTSLI